MAKLPEVHQITRIGANGTYSTGGIDFGPHRSGGGGGECDCSWSQITGKPNFATVATSGSYNDLGNKPTIPPAYDDSELRGRIEALEQGGGGGGCHCSWSEVTNKPAFAPVATSGSYNDLGDKPTIPEAYDDTALKNRVTALENTTSTLGKLTTALTVSNPVGQATTGKNYAVGTSLESILRDILTQNAPVTYTITFNPNGGSVSPTSGTTGTDGKLSSLPTPTHATDTFKGWFTAATGGNTVTTNTVFTSNQTIYAQWQAATNDLPVFATVSSLTSLDEVTVDYTQAEQILNMPAQTETNPIIIEVPTEKNFVLTMWNPLINQWVETPNKWDVSTVTRTIDGESVAYTRYTENCECDSGAIQIRLTWTV